MLSFSWWRTISIAHAKLGKFINSKEKWWVLKMQKIVRGWVFGGFLMSRQGTRVTWNILFETVTYLV